MGMSRVYDPEALLIGVIGRPHGLNGETSLRPYGGASDLSTVPLLILERHGKRTEWRVQSMRPAREGWLIRLEGVESRTDADALTNASVWVSRKDLPSLGPGEFYVEDVVGCRVETEEGKTLGVVEGIFWNGAHDVMTVGAATGAAEPSEPLLIPIVPTFVREVDAAAGRVLVAWEGEQEVDQDVDQGGL
jgi:16S rRNA processing protein RimM